MRRAVIDIGTNTVKLLVADVEDGKVYPVFESDVTTRLGEHANSSGQLTAPAITRTVGAIAQYVAEARRLGVTSVLAIATSAVREAANAHEFLAASPVPVEVITGKREAELIFRGVSSDPTWAREPLLVLDVGGGSAELIAGAAGKIERWVSMPIGAVRLKEQFGEENFSGLIEYLRRTLSPVLRAFPRDGRKLIGTGGGMITMARVATGASDHAVLSQDELRAWVSRLHALPLEERKRVRGLPADRADILVPGGMVFVVAMELLGASELTVSVRNLRYGAWTPIAGLPGSDCRSTLAGTGQ